MGNLTHNDTMNYLHVHETKIKTGKKLKPYKLKARNRFKVSRRITASNLNPEILPSSTIKIKIIIQDQKPQNLGLTAKLDISFYILQIRSHFCLFDISRINVLKERVDFGCLTY